MENLRTLRLKHSLSQAKLAEQFHMSQQAIHKYESGIAEPDIDRLKEFADFFHVSIDYLVGHIPDPGLTETSDMVSVPNQSAAAVGNADMKSGHIAYSDSDVSEDALLSAWKKLPKAVQSAFYRLMCLYE